MINILLIILLLLLGYTLIPGRIPENWKNPVVVGLVLAALATASVEFLLSRRQDPMLISSKYPVSVGYMLGRQIRADIKKRGVVAVVTSDQSKWASTRYLEGLNKALQGSSLTLLEPDYAAPSGDSGELAPGVLEKVFKKNPDAVAIVTFIGVPELRDADKEAGLPPLYVFQKGEAEYCLPWIASGIVWAACLAQTEADWIAAPARLSSLESAFKERFLMATPNNIAHGAPAKPGAKEK